MNSKVVTSGKAVLRVSLIALIMLGLSALAPAQVTIEPEDIPTENGTMIPYYTKNDTQGFPVDLGSDGPNREWDFTGYEYDGILGDYLVDPEGSPYYEDFPDANRVIEPAEGGTGLFNTGIRYETVADSGWFWLGSGTELMGDFGFPISFGNPILILPMGDDQELGAEWAVADTFDYYYTADTLQVDTLLLQLVYGGFAEYDAWGTVTYPGGEEEAIRVYMSFDVHLDVYAIQWFFNQRIVIPLGEWYRMDGNKMYTWYAPEVGELVRISSRLMEEEAEFDTAASIQVRYLPPDLNIPTAELVFGVAEVGETTGTTLSIENAGEYPGLIMDIEAGLGIGEVISFTDEFPLSVEPGETADLTVLWTPQEAGELSGTIYVTHNDPDLENPVAIDVAGIAENAVVGEGRGALPTELTLEQNYPNPFNPTTELRFGLPAGGHARVTVFDVLGREVVTLVNSEVNAGWQAITWNAAAQPSGFYFAVLEMDDQRIIRKMALTK